MTEAMALIPCDAVTDAKRNSKTVCELSKYCCRQYILYRDGLEKKTRRNKALIHLMNVSHASKGN